MIFSSIYANDDAAKYPKAIQTAIAYLKNNDFLKMDTGIYKIDGDKIYAQVFDATTGSLDEKRPEVHEKFIDVQFLANGEEKIGFLPDTGKFEIDERIDERDLIFYKKVENESFIYATPGCYSVFFPNDIHRPAVMVNQPLTIRKVVIKISVDLL